MLRIAHSKAEAVHSFANKSDFSTLVFPGRGTVLCNILSNPVSYSLGSLMKIQRLLKTFIEMSGPGKPRENGLICFSVGLLLCTGHRFYDRQSYIFRTNDCRRLTGWS